MSTRYRRKQKARYFWENTKELLRNLLPWAICLLIGGLIFWRTYYKYKYCPEYFYLRGILGESLGWSRGSAAVLWVSCSVILLPMCRNLLTFIRRKIPKFLGIRLKRIIDKNVWIHRACAVTTVTAAVIHTAAHLINGKQFSENYSKKYSELNFADYKNQNPLEFVLFSVAGSTGFAMMLILIVMISASMPSVRNTSYEVFWFTHHLFLVFIVLLSIHGLGGVVKHQTNLVRHPPGCDLHRNKNINVTSFQHDECLEPAEFEADEAQAWKFLFVPLCIYLLDRMIRFLRAFQHVHVVKVERHPCDVVELRLRKTRFDAVPGQYIYISCPQVAKFEWHPFTLTKCPSDEDQVFSIHFKLAGDWTRGFIRQISALREDPEKLPLLVEHDKESHVVATKPSLRICVDGPYGSPCMDVTEYEVSLCIATGIGVTPFAALFNSLRLQKLLRQRNKQLRRIYFVWVGRDVISFRWFVDILHTLHVQVQKLQHSTASGNPVVYLSLQSPGYYFAAQEKTVTRDTFLDWSTTDSQLWESNRPDVLVCRFYATGRQSQPSHKLLQTCERHRSTSTSWLTARLKQGRPDWQSIFRRVAQENPRSTVGVFYCGTRNVSTKLRKLCNKPNKTGSTFVYNKEVL